MGTEHESVCERVKESERWISKRETEREREREIERDFTVVEQSKTQ